MGPTKIMIIRHAEKPGIYNKVLYNGVNGVGQQDADSLVTMGWERAGGIANLFDPTNGNFQNAELATPAYIYASDPAPKSPKKYQTEPSGHLVEEETSQRPYQTISALAAKLTISPENLITSFEAKHYSDMVTNVLTKSGTVLIAWQHEDILPKHKKDDSIVYELFCQTGTINAQKQEPIPPSFNVPDGPWPGDRYDMVFVFDLSSEGLITAFTQVPQMLLAGDLSTLF
jgi:hypothetical protein